MSIEVKATRVPMWIRGTPAGTISSFSRKWESSHSVGTNTQGIAPTIHGLPLTRERRLPRSMRILPIRELKCRNSS